MSGGRTCSSAWETGSSSSPACVTCHCHVYIINNANYHMPNTLLMVTCCQLPGFFATPLDVFCPPPFFNTPPLTTGHACLWGCQEAFLLTRPQIDGRRRPPPSCLLPPPTRFSACPPGSRLPDRGLPPLPRLRQTMNRETVISSSLPVKKAACLLPQRRDSSRPSSSVRPSFLHTGWAIAGLQPACLEA